MCSLFIWGPCLYYRSIRCMARQDNINGLSPLQNERGLLKKRNHSQFHSQGQWWCGRWKEIRNDHSLAWVAALTYCSRPLVSKGLGNYGEKIAFVLCTIANCIGCDLAMVSWRTFGCQGQFDFGGTYLLSICQSQRIHIGLHRRENEKWMMLWTSLLLDLFTSYDYC